MIKRIIGMLLICSLAGCVVGNDGHNYNGDRNVVKSHLPLMEVDKLPNSIDVERAVVNFFKKHFNKKELTAIKPPSSSGVRPLSEAVISNCVFLRTFPSRSKNTRPNSEYGAYISSIF